VLINDIRALLLKDKNPLVKAPKGEEPEALHQYEFKLLI